MARTTRSGRAGGRRAARGSFGQWTTNDRAGAVREHAGWDAAALAFFDGGGCYLRLPDDPDGPDEFGGPDGADAGTGRCSVRGRTTRRSRKGGR